jgi:dienelactone hydrolase
MPHDDPMGDESGSRTRRTDHGPHETSGRGRLGGAAALATPPRETNRGPICRFRVVLLVVVVCSVLLPAAHATTTASDDCVGPDAQSAPAFGGDDAPNVTRIVFTFVDRGRLTDPDATRDHHEAPTCRVLETVVRMPTGASTPLPLILAVHGRDGDPTRLQPLLDTWVTAGYMVAAPYFLITDKDADDKPTSAAVRRQAADARFVLDQLLILNDDPASPLNGLIDVHRIGAAGMSLGGMTVYGLVSNTCCRDPRIAAALLLAGVHRDFDTGKYVDQHLPVMLIQGDKDIGYHNSVDAYLELAAPKWFVTLHGSTHSPPFEIPRGPEAQLVDATTTAFWNLYLEGRDTAQAQIVAQINASGGNASVQRQLAPRSRTSQPPPKRRS